MLHHPLTKEYQNGIIIISHFGIYKAEGVYKMKFCSNCGQQIDDNAKFCVHCGTARSTQIPTPQPMAPGGKQLHCPKCKGTQLSPIVETDVQGGYALNRSLGRKWSASAIDLKSVHKNYWMCRNCGHKFRQIDSLNEEIAVQAKAQRACVSTSILFLVLSLICMMTDAGLVTIAAIPLWGLMLGLWFWFKKKVAALTAEKKYLERNCFD